MPSTRFRRTLLALALALALPLAHAQFVGSAFTYQGELRAAGAAANAPYDFQFRLFNSAGGNTQVGTTVTVTAVSVINGLFSVPLDFGAAQFAGDAQWLEISVRPSSGGTFETLIPRTSITPTPYALGAVAALANSVTGTSIVDGAVQSGDLAAGAVGTAQVNAAQVQRRVSGTCSGTQGVQSIAQDGTVICGTFSGGGGTITQVTAGTGLTGGGTSGSVTVGIANGGVGTAQINTAQVQARVSGNCLAGQYVRVVNTDGTVICGSDANAGGTVTSIATGAGLTGGPVTGSGTIAVAAGGIGAAQINAAQVQARVAGACAVGQYVRQVNQDGTVVCGTDASGTPGWTLTGNVGTNPATNFIGTTDAQPLELRTANARSLRLEPSSITSGAPALPVTTNTIGGSHANEVSAGVRGATIDGGGIVPGGDPLYASLAANRVTDHFGTVGGGASNQAGDGAGALQDRGFSTVGGGVLNTAAGAESTIAGGQANTAHAIWGTIGGGANNVASREASVVAGGFANTAGGSWSVVAGGQGNCAGADFSWAGGRSAKVRPGSELAEPGLACSPVPVIGTVGDRGTFSWADSQLQDFVSTGSDRFLVRAQGGIYFGTTSTPDIPAGRFINTSTGAHLTTGGTWTNASSRALKTAFEAIDAGDVLARLLALPLTRWQYRDSPAEGMHLGPIAEDFHAAFGLGADGRAISTVDANGIALAAIQGLNAKLEDERDALHQRVGRLDAENAALRAELDRRDADFRARLEAIEARLRGGL